MSEFLRLQELIVSGEDYLILDTETTGLKNAEIVDIAIIDNHGKIILNTLVKPVNPIPPGATKINGITMEMVEESPTWANLTTKVRHILKNQNVVVYNATFDITMLHSSDDHSGIQRHAWGDLATWFCAMKGYAEFYGDWNEYHHSYSWQKLGDAYHRLGGTDNQSHRALLDCMMTLYVVRKMFEEKSK